jgi:hypothetical protein
MIQALLTVVLGFLVMGIIVALGVFAGELLIMANRHIPARYRNCLDYPVLLVALVSGVICAWFLGEVTIQVLDAVVGGLA